MGFRTYYFCDKMQDILVGVILGGLIGFLVFNVIYYSSDIGPSMVLQKKINQKNANYLKQNLSVVIVKQNVILFHYKNLLI